MPNDTERGSRLQAEETEGEVMNIIHAIGRCIDCNWETDARNAMGTAAIHHNKTGHEVHVETGYVHIYKRKAKEAPDYRLRRH